MQGRIQGRIIRPCFHHSLGEITLGSFSCTVVVMLKRRVFSVRVFCLLKRTSLRVREVLHLLEICKILKAIARQ
jgi:hypothetical protein